MTLTKFVHYKAVHLRGVVAPTSETEAIQLGPLAPKVNASIVRASNAAFEAIDRKNAIANMLLTGGLKDTPNETFEQRLLKTMEAARDARSKQIGPGAVLIMEKHGLTSSFAPDHLREMDSLAVCFDAVPENWKEKEGLSESDVSALVAAFGVTLPKLVGVERVSEALVFFRDDGKPVYSFRVAMGRARGYVSSPLAVEDIGRIVGRFRQIEADASLDRVVRLWYSGIQSKDTLRAFLSSWNGLEIFVGKVFDQYEALTLDRVAADSQSSSLRRYFERIRIVMKGKYRLADKFALVAAHLSPAESVADYAQFVKAKETRDRLSHGQNVDEEELPVSIVQELTRKYLRLHLEKAKSVP